MGPLAKYALVQIPGTVLAALVLAWAHARGWISPGWAVAAFVLWVAKDAALYPLLRAAYEAKPRSELEGERGRSRGDLDPRGWVFVRGELWKARVASGERVASGTPVRILRAEGRELVVERDASS